MFESRIFWRESKNIFQKWKESFLYSIALILMLVVILLPEKKKQARPSHTNKNDLDDDIGGLETSAIIGFGWFASIVICVLFLLLTVFFWNFGGQIFDYILNNYHPVYG